ncbi:hypothetical protein H5410_032713 [Solanum commersonii]|uniref:Uncharacterized protein n=1 Tax=Solanum commersonii TaxID=4109 RepID=A0A9J5YNQ1_SOLCO|nr:hypothetical protein H5410_032713 [Solanum commersonii]
MAEAINRRSSYAHGRNGQINFTSITIIYHNPHQHHYIFISPSSSSSSQRTDILIAFIFPAMVELLQLKYQPTNSSPFEIHPIKMYSSVGSFLIYSFACDAHLKLISTSSNHSKYAKMVGAIFGPLAFASYSSLLFPPFSSVFYSLSILYSATQLLNRTLLLQRLNVFYHKFVNYLNEPITHRV